MNAKRLLSELLLLLLAPAAVLALLAAWVTWANSRPAAGPLTATVRPAAVWPWQEAEYRMTVRGEARSAARPAAPVDLALLVDVSGSMLRSLPAMAQAAQQAVEELAAAEPGRFRFALIRFDTEAEINTPWTDRPADLVAGLRRLTPFTGENDSRAAFARLAELLRSARPGARQVAVFYTDGELDVCSSHDPRVCPLAGPMSRQEMAAASERLRRSGVELLAVSLPGRAPDPLLFDITGAPTRVFEPSSTGDLVRSFQALSAGVLGVPARGALLTHRLDGRHFAAPLTGTAWTLARDGSLALELDRLPLTRATYTHPLVPRAAGLWRVGVTPPRLSFIAPESGRLMEVSAPRRPLLLAITWWALFAMALPALLWLAGHLLRRRRPALELEATVEPPPHRAPEPTRLPTLPPPPPPPEPPVPTLFVGLGGGGRQALAAIQAELAQLHDGAAEPPFRYLTLDLDRRRQELAGGAGEPDAGGATLHLTAPAEVTAAAAITAEPDPPPPHLGWFDAGRYRDAAREQLDLASGSRGDRVLARRALFRWLERGELTGELARLAREVVARSAPGDPWQIVILASRDGGVGSGWFVDCGRLARRLGRSLQAATQGAGPEIVGILCDSPERPRTANRAALGLELETAMLAGAYPSRTVYHPGDPLLDRMDGEAPFSWVLGHAPVSGTAKTVESQCASTAAVLVERRPRHTLLAAAGRIAGATGRPVAASSRVVQVLPRQAREMTRLDLLLRLLGPDVLLDIEPAPGGGFALAEVTAEAARRRLTEWADAEPPGSLSRQLLAAAGSPAAAPAVLAVLARSAGPAESRLAAALLAGVNRRLRGAGTAGGPWRRQWMPAEAAAVLRCLGRDLRALAGGAAAAAPPAGELLTRLGQLAEQGVQELERWLTGASQACEELAAERRALAARVAHREQSGDRVVLQPPQGDAEQAEASRRCLEDWLGGADTVSPLRERLFLELASQGGEVKVQLRSFVDTPTAWSEPAAAVAALDTLAGALAARVPSARLDTALASLPAEEQVALARGLVDRSTPAEAAVLVAPVPGEEAAGPLDATLAGFLREVPQPPDQGPRDVAASAADWAVWRFALAPLHQPEGGEDCLVAAAEQAAETVRRRVALQQGMEVPIFPAPLRIALGDDAAFHRFADAYRSGQIVRRRDPAGREQWSLLDRDLFLSDGPAGDLAQAAATFAASGAPAPEREPPAGPPGDLSRVEHWRRSGGLPDADTLVLSAIAQATR